MGASEEDRVAIHYVPSPVDPGVRVWRVGFEQGAPFAGVAGRVPGLSLTANRKKRQ